MWLVSDVRFFPSLSLPSSTIFSISREKVGSKRKSNLLTLCKLSSLSLSRLHNLRGHNSTKDWWILFAFPNFQWILIPFIIAVVFGRELAAGLRIGTGTGVGTGVGAGGKMKVKGL